MAIAQSPAPRQPDVYFWIWGVLGFVSEIPVQQEFIFIAGERLFGLRILEHSGLLSGNRVVPGKRAPGERCGLQGRTVPQGTLEDLGDDVHLCVLIC